MMAVCAAKGCTARPAAKGLCTRHLGLDQTGKKPARPRVVFVDALPPHTKGKKVSPVDVDAAETLRKQPGKWGRFPVEARWPDAGEIPEKKLRSRICNAASTIRRSRGAWRGGVWEAETRGTELFVRFIGPDLGERRLLA